MRQMPPIWNRANSGRPPSSVAFNLIEARWLPVRRADGELARIAPWEITTASDGGGVSEALAPPRPDFAGALTEFLIGLLQVTTSPDEEEEWWDWWHAPPDATALRDAAAGVRHAFDLDGDGPRFMQDLEELESDPVSVGRLLIDAPGAKTLRDNTDLFVKRGRVGALCRPCAAAALFTLQAYAPSGGAGHRVSLRGGGPLTTVVVANAPGRAAPTLWSRLWPNVLPRIDLVAGWDPAAPAGEAAVFPWLAPTRTSGKGGRATYPQDMDPNHMYWGMPRRIRLDFTPAAGETCDLCGGEDEVLVRTYRTRPHGMNYEGAWRHPLTPYVKRPDGTWLPMHAQPGGVSYRHWLALTAEGTDRRRAKVVAHFLRDRQVDLSEERPRLAAFGYDMDNMKARAWYESEMPLWASPSDDEPRERFEKNVELLVTGADEAARSVLRSVRAAWFSRRTDARGDLGYIGERFWRKTEDDFFRLLAGIQDAIEAAPGDSDAPVPQREAWRDILVHAGTALFDDLVDTEGLELKDFRRVVMARRVLTRTLRYGKVPKALRLPEKPKTEEAA